MCKPKGQPSCQQEERGEFQGERALAPPDLTTPSPHSDKVVTEQQRKEEKVPNQKKRNNTILEKRMPPPKKDAPPCTTCAVQRRVQRALENASRSAPLCKALRSCPHPCERTFPGRTLGARCS